MMLAAWVLICIGFVMAEDPSASPSTTTTTRPTTTTTSAPKAKATSGSVFYNFGNNIELSFETISYITGGISIFLLLIIILVALCHKFSKKKLAARVSRLGADQERSHVGVGPRHIKVAPMPDTDSYPNPPDKLISKSPRSPRNDNQLTVTRSERSAKAKHVDVEGVKRQSLSSGSGKQQSSTIPDDNLTPVGNRGAKSKEKASTSKDKKSPRVPEKASPSNDNKPPRVPEKASPSKDKKSPRVPAARRATDGLL